MKRPAVIEVAASRDPLLGCYWDRVISHEPLSNMTSEHRWENGVTIHHETSRVMPDCQVIAIGFQWQQDGLTLRVTHSTFNYERKVHTNCYISAFNTNGAYPISETVRHSFIGKKLQDFIELPDVLTPLGRCTIIPFTKDSTIDTIFEIGEPETL